MSEQTHMFSSMRLLISSSLVPHSLNILREACNMPGVRNATVSKIDVLPVREGGHQRLPP